MKPPSMRLCAKQRPPTFSDSCLPLTLELATLLKDLIRPRLAKTPSAWFFEDRVLAWLLPDLAPDITRFYNGSGPQMTDKFQAHQLAHLDRDLLTDLVDRLDRIRPGVGQLLAERAN